MIDTTADYYNDPEGLVKLLLEEIEDYSKELQGLDINDTFTDYLEGSIAAREVVIGRLGYRQELEELQWKIGRVDC